ncbi:phosphoribosylanthranilate isomerase [Pontibacillus salicampi]|uniref:N-(5'-phosphoribosyl)anthranilate isomerase n=1 Tax=Pontibacillus salicampi TaxID=1449801 RepID=A0ABV6LID7_9BACI
MNEPMVKLCGNKTFDDFQTSASSGAPYLGIIFAESKRQVLPEDAGSWLKEVSLSKGQQVVGVFVNPSMNELEEALLLTPLDIIQLHGKETVAEILHIRERFDLPVFKAIHHSDFALEDMKLYRGIVDGFIVDAKVKGAWGGTGHRFEWETIPLYIEEAEHQGVPCFIAGGVNPDNIEELAAYQPAGIDVSSGTETNGRKDKRKIEAILRGSKHVHHLS